MSSKHSSPLELTTVAAESWARRAGAALRAMCLLLPMVLGASSPVWAAGLSPTQVQRLRDAGVVDAALVAQAEAGYWQRVVIALAGADHTAALGGCTLAGPPAAGAPARIASAVVASLGPEHFELAHRLDSLRTLAGRISPLGLLGLAAEACVVHVGPDFGGQGMLDEALPLVGLDLVHQMGWTGVGVTVAILDSGLDLDHPDLVGSVVAQHCVCTDCCPDGSSEQTGIGSAEDDNGHGTHVAGIVASRGDLAPVGGAPDVDIVAVKVLDDANQFRFFSDVLAGLEWVIETQPAVDVVNLSLGTGALFTGACDALHPGFATAIDVLRARGVPVLASSGNDGSGTELPAPACIANAIAVGATTDADEIPTEINTNDQMDLLAPGVGIRSTGVDGILELSGSSQATALAAACAAVLVQVNPDLSAAQYEAALESSTTSLTDAKNGLSFPRLDCAAAVVFVPEPGAGWDYAIVVFTLSLCRTRRRGDSAASPSPAPSNANVPASGTSTSCH